MVGEDKAKKGKRLYKWLLPGIFLIIVSFAISQSISTDNIKYKCREEVTEQYTHLVPNIGNVTNCFNHTCDAKNISCPKKKEVCRTFERIIDYREVVKERTYCKKDKKYLEIDQETFDYTKDNDDRCCWSLDETTLICDSQEDGNADCKIQSGETIIYLKHQDKNIHLIAANNGKKNVLKEHKERLED